MNFSQCGSAGHHPANRKIAGSVPGQGTCLGCRFGPQLGSLWEAADRCFSRTSMFLSFLSLLSKIKNKSGTSQFTHIVFLLQNLAAWAQR